MKKITAMALVAMILILSSGIVEARGSSSRSSSRSTTTRTITKAPTTVSKAPIKTTSATKAPTTTSYNRTTSYTQYSNPRAGGSPFLSSLGGSMIGTIGAIMIMNALTDDQTVGNTVNDGEVQYSEILSSTGAVVGYKPTGQLQKEAITEDEDEEVSFWLVAFLTLLTAMILLSIFSKD